MENKPYPTLLRYPVWWCGRQISSEHVLPLLASHYEVVQVEGYWIVRVRVSGEVIYQGIGPVDVVVSQAPF